MCGISGIINIDQDESINKKLDVLYAGLDRRGPDSKNKIIVDKYCRLAHSRLAIIDLTDAGSQPMTSNSGRYHIVFNGEIYNHKDIKNKYLKDLPFRGSSDTEILLNLIELIGLKKTLPLLNGVYAFFIFDEKEKEFFLCRDKLGEKPVCYYYDNKNFYFCSEVTLLSKILPKDKQDLDYSSIDYFLRYGNIPAPKSIFKNINKLLPGEIISGKINKNEIIIKKRKFWSVSEDYLNKIKEPNLTSINLENTLFEVVNDHLISDRTLGVFLSGGIDSSLVSCLATKIKPNINSFSIGFDNQSYNESDKAKKIASFLGTNHTEIIFNQNDVLNIVPNISQAYDEPFADQSLLPTMLLCGLSKKSNSIVCLTGDGGDELFGGYNRHKYFHLIQKYEKLLKILGLFKTNNLNINFNNKKLSDYLRWLRISISAVSKQKLSSAYFELLNKTEFNSLEIELGQDQLEKIEKSNISTAEKIMMFDICNYLTNDVLVKTDRASMFYGIEIRAPLLDPRIIDFSSKLEFSKKIQRGNAKKILKDILANHLPDGMINKKKYGFDVPISSWLKKDLKKWAQEIHNSEMDNINSKKYDFFFNNHVHENKDYSDTLWPYLMLKNWNLSKKL